MTIEISRSKNKVVIRYDDYDAGNGWTRGGVLGSVVALPGGFLVQSMTGRPVRVFSEEYGEESVIKWAIEHLPK